MELKGSSVPDQNGSPMNVSAIVTYKIVDPVASLFNVDDFKKYVFDQGLEVLKRVVSRFPYKSSTPGKPSLLDDTMIIGRKKVKINFRKMYAGSSPCQVQDCRGGNPENGVNGIFLPC